PTLYTLFTYTTLFRSVQRTLAPLLKVAARNLDREEGASLYLAGAHSLRRGGAKRRSYSTPLATSPQNVERCSSLAEVPGGGKGQDRKSTRLNSSHLGI